MLLPGDIEYFYFVADEVMKASQLFTTNYLLYYRVKPTKVYAESKFLTFWLWDAGIDAKSRGCQ